jgi:hypothetical protein
MVLNLPVSAKIRPKMLQKALNILPPVYFEALYLCRDKGDFIKKEGEYPYFDKK